MCRWDGCGLHFTTLISLVDHLTTAHVGTKQSAYVCLWEACPRRLQPQNSRFALISHLRGHTGERPFDCPVPECDKSFSRSDALAKHYRNQHMDRPDADLHLSEIEPRKSARQILTRQAAAQSVQSDKSATKKGKRMREDEDEDGAYAGDEGSVMPGQVSTAHIPFHEESDSEDEFMNAIADEYGLSEGERYMVLLARYRLAEHHKMAITMEINNIKQANKKIRNENRRLFDQFMDKMKHTQPETHHVA